MLTVRAQLLQMGSEVDEDASVEDGEVLVLFRMRVEEARKLAPALTGDEVTLSVDTTPDAQSVPGLPMDILVTVKSFAEERGLSFEATGALCYMAKRALSSDDGDVWAKMILGFEERFRDEVHPVSDEDLSDELLDLLRRVVDMHAGA